MIGRMCGQEEITELGDTALKGILYSVRIYNRALTDEEIEHNYQLDRQRFGIE